MLLCPNSLLFASDVTLPHQTPKETTHEVACLAGLRPSRRSPKPKSGRPWAGGDGTARPLALLALLLVSTKMHSDMAQWLRWATPLVMVMVAY